MKKLIFTLIIFGVLAAVPKLSEAQRNQPLRSGSELKLRMYDNSMFVVIFDRRIYDSPTSLFRLSNIQAGTHRLVIKKRYGRYGTERTVYNGSIKIPPRSIVSARINRYNRFEIVKINEIGGYGYGNGNYNNGYNNNYSNGYYNKPMLDLPRLQNSMRLASFENDKLRIARQAISTHRVRANQVYRIMTVLSFESSKLKLAKFAYRHCVDKQKYYLVNDAFSFSSSIRELDNYIGGFRSDYYDDDWDGYGRDYNDNW